MEELRIQEEKELASVELMENSELVKEEIRKKFDKKRDNLDKKKSKNEIKLQETVEDAKVNTIQMGFQAASMFAEEGSAAAKGIAVAQTIFNTQQAIMKAMADVPAPMNFIQSALAAAMGAKSIQTIMSTDPSGKGGGGGGGGGGAGAAPPAPQMMSGAFDLSGVTEPEPVKAFVVTDEMTSSQNQLANIRRRATI
jgi:hypothetical protein